MVHKRTLLHTVQKVFVLIKDQRKLFKTRDYWQ